MSTITIDKSKAIQEFNKANPAIQEILINIIGKENLAPPVNIRDRVNNFDDILAISGKTMDDIARPGDTEDEIAYKQAKLIALVYNEGAVLDPLNTDQYKYYPWHKISGSGLSCLGFDYWFSYSNVGVRLCFKNEDDAIDAGKKFIDIYTRLKIK